MFKALLVCLLLLCSCSVHPLHSYDPFAQEKLTQIKLGNVEGENVFLIKQSFAREFYPLGGDAEKSKQYSLNLKIASSVSPWLIQSNSEIIRNVLTLTATFELKSLETGSLIRSGSIRTLRTFVESPSAWSSYTSQKEAYANAVSENIKSLRLMLVTYLSQNKLGQ